MESPSRSSPLAVPRADNPSVGVSAAASPGVFTPEFSRLLLVQLSFGLSFSTYFLLPKYLTTVFHASATTIGAAAATPLVAGVLASPGIGYALDRFGRRSSVLVGALVGASTSFGISALSDVGVAFFVLRAVQGIGFALVFNGAVALAADRAPAARLGYAMGLLGSASLVTNAIGPTIAEHAADVFGWSLVFATTAVMSVLTFVLALGITETRREPSLGDGARGPQRLRFGAAAAIMGAAFGTLVTFTQPLALSLGAERVAGFFLGYTVAALLVRLGLGSAADRFGRVRVSRLSLVFYGIVTMSTAFLQPNLLELYGLGFGVAHGLLYPALAALVAEHSPASHRGRSLTNFNASFNAGCGLSLVGCGMLAETTGYPVVFLGVGLLTTLSVALLRNPAPSRT